jgi:hypothetical protein
MEWLSTNEDLSQTVASVSRAFEVLRQNPAKCVENAQKVLRKTRSAAEDSFDDDVAEILSATFVTGEARLRAARYVVCISEKMRLLFPPPVIHRSGFGCISITDRP